MNDVKDYYVQLGVAHRIPIAFERFCDKTYSLEKLFPEVIDDSSEDYKIKVVFNVLNEQKEKVATFQPDGKYEYFSDSFKPIFDKIVEELGYAAYRALKAQEELDKKILERFDDDLYLDG
ncbi:MAG: hypothetical protein HZR80_19275 [Candidatus Heimdallarchaeota archaeon]